MPKKITLSEVGSNKVKKLNEGFERKKKNTVKKSIITIKKPVETLSTLKVENENKVNIIDVLDDKSKTSVEIQQINPKVTELLTEISKKLDMLITNIVQSKIEKPTHVELYSLQLSELKFLKEVANDTIILNKYPGGDNSLIQECANLANRIDTEIHKRLKLY